MKQPKRWSHGLTGMSRNRSGPWVTWDDYAALAADNERLRKAGDAMAYIMEYEKDNEFDGFVDAWNAAKEGRDAK